MTTQELIKEIARLKQLCEDTKQQLNGGKQNLQQLQQMIYAQTRGSRTGEEATKVVQSSAMKLNDSIKKIQQLETVLISYLNSVRS